MREWSSGACSKSSANNLEAEGVETRQLRASTRDEERQIIQLQSCNLEFGESKTVPETEVETLKIHCDEMEASQIALKEQLVQLQEQISHLESSLAASEEGRSQAERALAQLQQQHEQLQASTS